MKTYSFIEATKVLNTSESTLNNLLTSGVIPAAKIGQSWCIPEESLDSFLRAEVERQTVERLEFSQQGKTPRVPTAAGSRRTIKPDLEKMAA